MRKNLWKAVLWLAILVILNGCAAHKIYRSDFELCSSAKPEEDCKQSAYQRYRDPTDMDGSYDLGFIEFDDQGQLHTREQMQYVLGRLYEQAARRDLLLLVFVHGWKHSAAPRDSNIDTFRQSLAQLGRIEHGLSRRTRLAPRAVVGVYIGWRGGSLELPWAKELTFWDRKNTAHKVGHGGVTEVLARLELLKKTKDSLPDQQPSRTRLVIVGHSFGGAVVYSALSQLLGGRFIDTVGPVGQVSSVEGFGDLVVLINPAFEASRFAPLSDMANERRTYFRQQLPVLAVLTSEADDATRIAFPLGRKVSTVFEKHRVVERVNGVTGNAELIDQYDADVTAIGHFVPYRTHYLHVTGPEAREAMPRMSVERVVDEVFEAMARWQDDRPGSRIPFEGSLLVRTDNSAGRNPYLNIYVDEELIRDHNDLDDPRIASFVRRLILVASDSDDPSVRKQVEAQRARIRYSE